MQLQVESVRTPASPAWLAALTRRHEEWLATRPPLPDSTAEIAEDRSGMPDRAVDSSVAVKWAVTKRTRPALGVLAAATAAGDEVWLLELAVAEVANAVEKYDRKLLTIDGQFLADFLHIPMQIAVSGHLLPAALEIAMKYRCGLRRPLRRLHGGPGSSRDHGR